MKIKTYDYRTTTTTPQPHIAIVTGVHGEEINPVRALREMTFTRGAFYSTIVANEEALMRGRRFVDCDLNRSCGLTWR